MLMVRFEVRTIDQDVVEVYDYAIVKQRAEDIVDKSLEGSRGIGEVERHYREFIMSIACPESCLWYVFVLNADLVVAGAEIKFGENFRTLDTVEDFINTGERVPIFDS